jgi:hypothetical protein
MVSNLARFEGGLEALVKDGDQLGATMEAERLIAEMKRRNMKGKSLDSTVAALKGLPSFNEGYQRWYSEAKAVIKQLLPDRLADFVRHYEKPKPRKDITYENYKIEDYLQGLTITRGYDKETVVGPDAAIPQFRQQLAILKAVRNRFKSSLFDIRQLVQADLFDSELDAATELAKKKFTRAAGALAGVVLEKHLGQACDNHEIKVTKKAPTIGDLNNALKEAAVIDVPQWRFIQHLADIRNLCDHNKKVEPTPGQVDDLIAGVMRTTKTVF